MRTGIVRLLAAAVAICAVATSATTAFADGGQSIAAATPVTFNQQLFGNTANGGQDAFDPDCEGVKYRSWWMLGARAGDRFTIDWESQENPRLVVLPVGTNDFNFQDRDPVKDADLHSNHKAETRFRATQTGAMPMEFITIADSCNIYDSTPGPYDFVATVKHALVATLAKHATRKHVSHFTARAWSPDGHAVNSSQLRVDVYVRKSRSGSWHRIKRVGLGNFTLRWMRKDRRKNRWVRVRIHGSGYVPATSRSVRVKP